MVFLGIALLILAGIAVAVGLAIRGQRRPGAVPSSPAAIARRVYLYGIALSALGMLVAGLSGLLHVLLEALVAAAGVSAGAVQVGDARERVSFFGALTAIGVIGWAIHWGLAERSVRRGDPAERRSGIRKLFLYATLLIGGLLLTLNGRRLLADLLRLAFGVDSTTDLLAGDVLDPLATLVVSAAFWWYYAAVARADRRVAPEVDDGATLRRWCVYGLSFFGLFLFLFPATDLLQTFWEQLTTPAEAGLTGDRWLATAVAGQVSSTVAGLALWYLAWRHSLEWLARAGEPDPESRSIVRKVYLYVVLGIVVAWTVWNLGGILYGLVRTALIPERSGIIRDLGTALSTVLVFGLAWLYHAYVIRREAALAGEAERQATIRRLYEYLVALVGGVTLAAGLAGTLSTVLDLLVQSGISRPTYWWEDRISLFATLVVVGLPVWLLPWARLQREAVEPAARQASVRRIYLFLALGISVLTLLGSGAFTLYRLIQVTLGERWTASETSDLITTACSAAVAALFLAYHLRVFRRDSAAATGLPPGAPTAPAVALILVRAATPDLLDDFRRRALSEPPSGVELELVDLDADRAERILGEARAASGEG